MWWFMPIPVFLDESLLVATQRLVEMFGLQTVYHPAQKSYNPKLLLAHLMMGWEFSFAVTRFAVIKPSAIIRLR